MVTAPLGPRLVVRPVRSFPPGLPTEPLVIAAPPVPLEPEGSKWATTLLPALSSLGVVGFAVASGSALYLALGVGMAVLAVGATIGMRIAATRARRRRQDAALARYSAHLDQRHTELGELAARQRLALVTVHPDPGDWPVVLAGTRLWERRPSDDDFLAVRAGRGRRPLAGGVRCEPTPPGSDEEADLRHQADLLVALHGHIDDVPLAIDLRAVHALGLVGPASQVWPALRALVVGLALVHAPGEVSLAGLVPDEEAEWLARLPHFRARATDADDLARLVGERAPGSGGDPPWAGRTVPHTGLVLVVSAAACRRSPTLLADWTARPDLTCLVIAADDEPLPPSLSGLASLDDEGLTVRHADGSPPLVVARPDAVGLREACRFADELGGLRAAEAESSSRRGPVRLRPLLESGPSASTGSAPAGQLLVPLGRDLTDRRLDLDLAEAALGGSGPHGLLIGATGSGKSELLRTVIAGLVHRYSPADLGLVCWDFKGGAAVLPFAGLPHVRGTVTNLESEPRLLERADRSLRAEMRRRQQLLRDAGVDSVSAYRRSAPVAAPLPTLVLVVDEFSELLGAAPDLLDLFVSLGRLGRSLGIHLLLASQRLEEGRLRGLESHLRYRICLRTFSAADSTAVLGTDAAHRLPAAPGGGLFAVDGAVTRFDAALADDLDALVTDVAARWAGAPVPDATLWHPPLPADLPPSDALPGVDPLRVAVGLVDRPDRQTRERLETDLSTGHLAVVGAPRSGRSTAAAAVVAQLAGATSPEELQVYVLTESEDDFAAIAGCPHVGTIASIDDHEQVAAVVDTLASLCRTRDGSGRAAAVDDRFGAVVLVVDGWTRLRRSDESAAEAVAELAAGGRRRGLHLIVTGGGWGEFRAGLREHLSHRWELRLTDPYESEHGKARAASLPADRPGRLLTPSGHEAHIARPAAFRGQPRRAPGDDPPRAPALRALPSAVALGPLLVPGLVRLGVGGGLQEPAGVDIARPGRHLLVAGDGGSGRSTTLRTVLRQLDGARVDLWVLDRRRSLRGAVAPGSRYATTPRSVAAALDDLAEFLRGRLPTDDADPAWPEAVDAPAPIALAVAPPQTQVLVVDDYDLLPGVGLAGGLGPLAEFVPFAQEIGLSVVLARRSGARGAYDQGWQLLVDGGCTALALSGDPMDGSPFPGLRPQALRPGRGVLLRPASAPQLIHVAADRSAAFETPLAEPRSYGPAVPSADTAGRAVRSSNCS